MEKCRKRRSRENSKEVSKLRITQNMLDGALERLARTSKVSIKTNDCYGYSQLMTSDGYSLYSTQGDTKKDLYYQIQFYLDMKEAEKRLKGKRY